MNKAEYKIVYQPILTQAAITKYTTDWVIILLMVLEAGKPKIKLPVDSLSGEGLFLAVHPHMVEEDKSLPFLRALIPFMRSVPL